MNHEKIIKRDDGTQVQIQVSLGVDFREYWWSAPSVSIKYSGKRKFIHMVNYTDSLVTPEEILEAKLELWNKIKPTL